MFAVPKQRLLAAALVVFSGTSSDVSGQILPKFGEDSGSQTRKCDTGNVITKIQSVFSNSDEERAWTFHCGTVGQGVAATYSTNGAMSTFQEQIVDQSCVEGSDGPGAWAGFLTDIRTANNGQDRRWRTDCYDMRSDPSVGNFINCAWRKANRNFDENFDLDVKQNGVLTSHRSEFDDDKDDRLWEFKECDITCNKGYRREGRQCISCTFPTYQDEDNVEVNVCKDQPQCSTGQFFEGWVGDAQQPCLTCGSESFTVAIGTGASNTQAADTVYTDVVCPSKVTSNNAEFAIAVSGSPSEVTATKTSSSGGWNFNLEFACKGVPATVGVKTYRDLANHRETSCLDHSFCGKGKQLDYDGNDRQGYCIPCPKNSFMATPSHQEGVCDPCPDGTFTWGTGSETSDDCIRMKITVRATTHRIWFILPDDAADPSRASVDCLSVSVSAMDLSQASSNPLLVRPQSEEKSTVLPETCDGVKILANSEKAVWNRYPLSIQGGSDFVGADGQSVGMPRTHRWVRANPGQVVNVAILPTDRNGDGSPVGQEPIRFPDVVLKCGCVAEAKMAEYRLNDDNDNKCIYDGDPIAPIALDCIPLDDTSSVEYETDETGKPKNFRAVQKFGRVYYSFEDSSYCEDSFAFTRDGQSFTSDLPFTGSKPCFEPIAPETMFDDLNFEGSGDGGERTVGTLHRYCTRAISNIGVGARGYRSSENCIASELRVAWEASITGTIKSEKAGIPVSGVTITYAVQMPSTTDKTYGSCSNSPTLPTAAPIFGKAECAEAAELVNVLQGATFSNTDVVISDDSSHPDGCFWDAPNEILYYNPAMLETGASSYVPKDTDLDKFISLCTVSHSEGATGTATSAADGSFVLHAFDENLPTGTTHATIKISMSKTSGVGSGTIHHQFVCGDHYCGPGTGTTAAWTQTVKHLNFVHEFNVLEVTSVPFAGKVAYPLGAALLPEGYVERNNAPVPMPGTWTNPGGASADAPPRCLLPKATVCLHDYDDAGNVLSCIDSDMNGEYQMAAPPGIRITVRVTLGSHVDSAFKRDRAANVVSSIQLLYATPAASTADNAAAPAVAAPQTEEVFTLRAGSQDFASGMDYLDETTRVLRLGAHGTLCQLALGNDATFSFSIPGCGRIEQTLPTSRSVYGDFLLPAHGIDVSFEAVAPPYPEVTDKSDFGFFNRLRDRTRRVDLTEPLTDEESSAGAQFLLQFQYHPKPTLAIAVNLEGADGSVRALAETDCTTAATIDLQIAEQTGDNTPSPLGNEKVPRWAMRGGLPVSVDSMPRETIKFPLDDHKSCSWVDAVVRHESRLGLSNEDLQWYVPGDIPGTLVPEDKYNPEYKDFSTVLERSLPQQASPELTIAALAKCTQPGDPTCEIETSLTQLVQSTTQFGEDDTCTTRSVDGDLVQGFSAIVENDVCLQQWSFAINAEASQSQHRPWHLLEWGAPDTKGSGTTLFETEREAWRVLVGVDNFEAAWTGATVTGRWSDFSKAILAPLKPWALLSTDEQAAASALHYTPETLGRGWAFIERMVHGDTSVLPNWNEDLLVPEINALVSLGWSETRWETPNADTQSNLDKPTFSDLAASSNLSEEEFTGAVNDLRITEWQWNRVAAAVDVVQGCFWDQARGSVVSSMWTGGNSIKSGSSDGGPGRNRRETASIPECPAGEEALEQTSVCSPCRDGFYKTNAMFAKQLCTEKTASCNAGYWLIAGGSKLVDDNLCIQDGFCPAGMELLGGACKTCKQGFYQQHESQSECLPKTMKCGSGDGMQVGTSLKLDDNVCIPCAPGMYSKVFTGDTVSGADHGYGYSCVEKQKPSSCNAGEYAAEPSSRTTDDWLDGCAPCPFGTWKNGKGVQPCTKKRIVECDAGFYFRPGASAVFDDSVCIPCPLSTYSSTLSTAGECIPKSPATCYSKMHFKGVSTIANDFACVREGECPAGYEFSADAATYPCKPCEPGFYKTAMSTSACTAKAVSQCGAGSHVSQGSSTTLDDSACLVCRPGTYKTAKHPADANGCFLKRLAPQECAAGQRLAPAISTTADDQICTDCPPGTFRAGSDAISFCTPKSAPVGGCGSGQYFDVSGTDPTANDWGCTGCPNDQFKSATDPTDAVSCSPKTLVCSPPYELVLAADATSNNECAVPGRCDAGFRVTASLDGCEACPPGQYSPGPSVSQECSAKLKPSCGAGTFYAEGLSLTSDDWRCAPCTPGKFAAASDTNVVECTDKVAPDCNPDEGMVPSHGKSKTEDDWFCVPAPRFTVMCAKVLQKDAVSRLHGLMSGLPERVSPFTKSYSTSIVTRGHTRVKLAVEIVVTGERFISAAEKISFPEGLPLLTLHDPPGGSSFCTFQNARATSTYYESGREKEKYFEADFATGAGISEGAEVSQLMVGIIPGAAIKTEWTHLGYEVMVGGYMNTQVGTATATSKGSDSAPPGAMFGVDEADSAKALFDQWNPDAAKAVGDKGWTGDDALGSDDYEFSYQTSAEPDNAGAASDSFLMPALTFEITEVWVVMFNADSDPSTANSCLIGGRADKSLAPRPDLNAFYFTMAVDVETRTLPVLLDVSADVAHRLACADYGECCTEADVAFGCVQDASGDTLSAYCDFLHGDQESESWQLCYSITEDRWKQRCDKASQPAAGVPFLADDQCVVGCPTQCPAGSKQVAREECTILPADDDAESDVDTDNVFGNPDDFEDMGQDEFQTMADEMAASAPSSDGAAEGCKIRCTYTNVVDPTEPVGACSKSGIQATDLKSYCDQKYPTDSQQAMDCLAYTPPDTYSRAHDDWFNTLARNYAKQEAANNGQEGDVSYQPIDTLVSPTPGESILVGGELSKMTDLAPHILVDNAMDRNGQKFAGNGDGGDMKINEFKLYSSLGFEGGGSSMEYTWGTGDVDNGNDFTGYDLEQSFEYARFRGGASGAYLTVALQFSTVLWETEATSGGGAASVDIVTRVETKSDGSTAMFHLEDGELGDYFVISVWNDPEYPTPMFSIGGGASSCRWEAGTYHRSAPSLEVEYIGPDAVPPNEPALFRIRITNAVNYYEGGPGSPEGGKNRPGWTSMDFGYNSPSMELMVDPATITDGLRINGGAKIFHNFGKQEVNVLVEVRPGPVLFDYPAPIITFGERCGEAAISGIGEQAVGGDLGMAGPAGERRIQFIKPCPAVKWSGPILSQGTFAVLKSPDGSTVDFMVRSEDKGIMQTTQQLEFQYRFSSSDAGAGSAWARDLDVDLAINGVDTFVAGSWLPPAGTPAGMYDIRVVAVCNSGFPDVDFTQETPSTTIQGTVDRKAPRILSVTATSPESGYAGVIAAGTEIIFRFDEPVDCNNLEMLTASTSVDVADVTFSGGDLIINCENSLVAVGFSASGAQTFEANGATLIDTNTFVFASMTGISDVAGNQIDNAIVKAPLGQLFAPPGSAQPTLARIGEDLCVPGRSCDELMTSATVSAACAAIKAKYLKDDANADGWECPVTCEETDECGSADRERREMMAAGAKNSTSRFRRAGGAKLSIKLVGSAVDVVDTVDTGADISFKITTTDGEEVDAELTSERQEPVLSSSSSSSSSSSNAAGDADTSSSGGMQTIAIVLSALLVVTVVVIGMLVYWLKQALSANPNAVRPSQLPEHVGGRDEFTGVSAAGSAVLKEAEAFTLNAEARLKDEAKRATKLAEAKKAQRLSHAGLVTPSVSAQPQQQSPFDKPPTALPAIQVKDNSPSPRTDVPSDIIAIDTTTV